MFSSINVITCIFIIMPSVFSDKTLTVDVLTDHEVQASFLDNRGNSIIGIKLSATADSIKLESIQDEKLVMTQYLNDEGDQFIGVLDAGFVRLQGRDYVIPKELIPQASQAKSQEDLSLLMEQLPSMQSSESVIEGVLRQLADKSETQLFIEASEALGKQGITGSSHPEVLPFFILAIQLHSHDKIGQSVREDDTSQALNLSASCLSLESDPYSNSCFGMCGKTCNCWSIVCGDCCYHQGCADHDACCGLYGYISWACLFPVRFSCSGYSAC